MLRVVLVLSLALWSCSEETAPGGCASNADCRSGSVCDTGSCVQLCVSQSDCPSGQVCLNDLCQTMQAGQTPVIELIAGNDAADRARIADGLVISGARLGNAEIELRSTTELVPLTVRTRTDTEIEIVLPADVVSGDYTLVATNAAGSTQAPVTLELPEITGDIVVGRINAADTTARIALARLESPVQRLVSGACSPGQSIRRVNADGTVDCETHLTAGDVATEVASAIDADGDGRLDTALLPMGLLRHRVVGGKTVYTRSPGSRAVVRDFAFLKEESATVLEITAVDSGGPHMDGAHTSSHATEISVDDVYAGVGLEHQSNGGAGWRLWPRMQRHYVSGIAAGLHNVKYEYRQENASHYYFGWTGYNHFEVREVPATEVRGTETFGNDIRNAATSFTAVTSRDINYTKVGGPTIPVLVTINDTWGSQASVATSTPGCRWQLYVDGASTGRDAVIHHDADDGWMIFAQTLGWVVTGLNSGAHFFDLRVVKESGSIECLNGWGSWGFISVLELDPNRSAIAANFTDVSTTSTAWSPIAGRTVSYIKKEGAAATDLRVLWSDNAGYYQAAHNSTCGYRLMMDGAEVASAQEHSSAIGAWRLKPTMQEFVVRNVPAGNHDFAMHWITYAGASTCRNGWTMASGASSFLVVTETPKND